jgi:hypothetical protein
MRIKGTLIALGVSGLLIGLASPRADALNPPVNPTIIAPLTTSTSIAVGYGLPGPTSGFIVQASTNASLTPVFSSSTTFNAALSTLTVGGLLSNTTYFLNAGALYSGTTIFALTNPPAMMTLGATLSGVQYLQVGSNTVTARWNALPGAAAVGYVMDVSTSASFVPPIFSSKTLNLALSTLTVSGLPQGTLIFVRVGSLNAASIPNFIVMSSTVTQFGSSGSAPINPSPLTISTASITIGWGNPGATLGYDVQASTTFGVLPPILSSHTTNGLAAQLTVPGLAPNTTYYLQAGAVYAGTTSYALTTPAGVVTFADLLTGGQILSVSSKTLQAAWDNPGAGNAIGYLLDASTNPTFTGTISSSATFSLTATTLTVSGLTPGTSYYVRLGAFNWNNVPNFTSLGSTMTAVGSSGAGPVSPVPVLITSGTIQGSWSKPGSNLGYVMELSTSAGFLVPIYSSITTDDRQTNLTVASLTSNTTYFMRVGALYAGSTSYVAIPGGSVITLSDDLTGTQIISTSSSTVSAAWNALGTPNATGYRLDVSTSTGFSGLIKSSSTTDVNLTTLTVSGLVTGTTYYIRAGGLNAAGIPNFSLIGSTITSGASAPTGLVVNAASLTSITWLWGTVSGATAYNLYNAGSPTTALYTGASANFVETGLSTNTAYTRAVTAVVGTEGSLSPAVTGYTLAAAPGMPSFPMVGISSITLNWATNGNPGNTPYEISRSTTPGFSAGVSTPIILGANFTGNTTTFINLFPSTTYYFRVRAANGMAILTAFSPIAPIQTGTPSGTGMGAGSAAVRPTSVQEGSIVTTTVTFVVPPGGMAAGGRLEVDLPAGWGPAPQTTTPGQPGYTVYQSTSTTPLALSVAGQGVILSVPSGFVQPGTQIDIGFWGINTNCQAPIQNAVWGVKTVMGTGGTLSPIAAAPIQTVTVGAARWLNYVPWTSLTVAVNQPSTALVLQGSDGCGQPAPLAAPLTLNFTGLMPDQTTSDAGAIFSLSPSMAPTITSLVVPAASTATVFYYQTSSSGNNLWLRGTYTSPFDGTPQAIWRSVNVLASVFSFGTPSLDNGVLTPGQTTMTLTPGDTTSSPLAYLRFQPTDVTTVWHVSISSDGFNTVIFDRWGSSNPLSSLAWDGRDFRNGSIVPNGVYTVKLDVPGLVTNTTLSVNVLSAKISGTVTLGGVPVAGAFINAQGTSATGWSGAQTDASGNYTLYGLKSGAVYNLFANIISTATQTPLNSQILNVTAPAINQNFALSSPGLVRIAATATSPAPYAIYGSMNLFTAGYAQNFWGNLRLLSGSTASDNGDPFNPSTWTLLGVPPGNYTLHLNMQGYAVPDQPVVVVANQSTDVTLTLNRSASIFGMITLPAPATVPTWVSVQGTPNTSTIPTIYGGASFSVGQSTAIYGLYAVNPGTYSLVAQQTGYIPYKITNVMVGSSDLGDPINGGGVDFSSTGFSVGGTISGNLTINGDTSGLSNPMTLWVNAFSQQLGQQAFTQVQLSTNTISATTSYALGGLANGTYQVFPPYLSGFSSNPPGPQSVTVVAGVGALNITMTKNTGQISGTITLPGVNSDYDNVHLSLQGPTSQEVDLPAGPAAYSLTGLNTGLYSLVATYKTTGAQVRTPVSVTNSLTSTVNLILNATTYQVSGTVSVQSGFPMTDTTGALVTVNTITDLLNDATTQTLTFGGTFGPSATGCVGGTQVTTTTARVEAFPKDFNSYNAANRSGFNNCFGVGQYHYSAIAPDGSYTITGLTPGLWEIDVYPYFDNGSTPDVAVSKRVVSILASNATVDFGLSQGSNVSGTISFPTGVSDNRTLNLQVVSDRGETIQTTTLQMGAAGSPVASSVFTITNLPNGNYSIVVQDPGTYDTVLQRNLIKYVGQPVQFQISGGDVTNVNITLANASRIVGQLAIQGTDASGNPALTLITNGNQNLLPDNFNIYAQANPWVPSGFVQANRQTTGPKIDIDANSQFTINGLIAGTYDVSFQQNSFGTSVLGQGSLNIASYTRGAVVVPAGQTLDLGTITLQPGIAISGIITDTVGTPLANIRVRAQPSNSQHGSNGQETFTDATGKYTFSGLNPSVKTYDFVAAPRPSPQDTVQPVPFGQVKRLAVDVTTLPPPTLNFTLPSATAGFTGTIATSDNGPLSFPDGDQAGYPAAAIFVNLQGTNMADNPLGDENASNLSGSFTISNYPAGIYDLTIESLGYRPVKITGVTLTNALKNLGTITLQKGPALQTTLTKPDGSAVNTTDVHQAVAVTPDLSSIIFGQINSDAQTNNILSIKFAGFELSPKTYNVLLFDTHDNIIVPVEGKSLTFAANSDSVVKALTFQPTAPIALPHIDKSGTDVIVTFYLSRPLRNGPADQDPTSWISRSSGSGSLSNISLSGDRRQFTVTYTPAAGEQNATLLFSAHTVDIDPSTGVEYVLSRTVTLLLGQKSTTEQSINPALGGSVSLSDSQDPTNVSIPANALLNADGSAADATSSYALTLSATEDASQAGASHLQGAPRVSGMMARGPYAYLSESYAAMQAARSTANVNPLSSFYSILLPGGLSHTLNQNATVTLNYDSGADPNMINVYYFNGNQYIIEQTQRSIDTVNRTISVNVSHFSTFVVLQNNQPVVTVDGDTGSAADIDVFNFPNPFDLQSKTKTLSHGGTTTELTTEGTIIRYFVPASMVGAAKIDIYDIVGEKVRSLDLGVPAGDTFHYVAWDGRNDHGKQVASGVYIGMLKVGSGKKFFKMAVIK